MKETLVAGAALLTGVCLMLAALALAIADASGQTTAVCSNTPGTDERIECTEAATATDSIDVEPATGVVADRDFSAQDFTETAKPQPPVQQQSEPGSETSAEPESQTSAAPSSGLPAASQTENGGVEGEESGDAVASDESEESGDSGETGESNRFEEVYAPRAAVYEGLPGALLSLSRMPVADTGRLHSPDSPVWFRITSGKGSHEPERATVSAAYDIGRVVAEGGVDIPLSEDLTAQVGALLVRGSVDVSAPTGGGTISATGRGLMTGVAWEGEEGLYGNARLSAIRFELNAASDTRGTLEQDIDARVHSLDFEAGRRFDVGEKTRLTARAWLNRTDASLQRFTDAVGTRVSLTDADALTIGAGGIVEHELEWNGGEESLSLHGSLGMERTVEGGETAVLVSGETLLSTSPNDGVVLGVGATRRWGRFALGAELRARGLGSKDNDYSGRLAFRMAI